ncbi:HNH endonuclease [Mycoplasma sp. AC157]
MLKYNHIVGNKIENLETIHPLEGKNNKDKEKFMKILVEFLSKNNNVVKYEKLFESKEIFSLNLNNKKYNIFIEHTDNGGRNNAKKIAITNNKKFRELIKLREKCLIINVYIPFSNVKELDYSNTIFFIINPEEFIKSKSMESGTSSSRWVTNEEILNCINEQESKEIYKLNYRNNVYIIHNSKILDFFLNEIPQIYLDFYKKDIERELKLKTINRNKFKNPENENKYRRLFRQYLFNVYPEKCAFQNCDIDIPELLIASHIKPINEILKEKIDIKDKREQICDYYNGFIFCANHDKLFDKFLISFDIDGNVLTKENKFLKSESSFFQNTLKDKIGIKISVNHEKYLKFHRDKTLQVK